MSREDDLVGQILLGKLEVLRKLGGGGMGEVYEVEHRLTGHRRALKVVQAQYADRPRFMKRLLREAKVAGTLGTEHVVETYDAGRLETGAAYVLMELLVGETLYEAFQREGRIAPRRLASIMAQVAEGIEVAHRAGIIHRDLKPENIFLLAGEGEVRVKILDFGVSKFEQKLDEPPSRLTAEGTLVGTPYYMSPEQASGKPIDARTDVYAMGVMMYECLTGRLPFEAASVGELFVKIAAGECVPLEARMPDLDPRWPALVHRAFHRRPADRFPDSESLRRAILPLLEGGSTAARAKTISDGARATIGFGEPLPAPPPAPRESMPTLAGPSSRPPAPRDTEVVETRPAERSDPTGQPEVVALGPPAPAEPTRPWVWALIGAAVVLALGVPYLALRDSAPVAETPTAAAPVRSPPAPARDPEPLPAAPELAAPVDAPDVTSVAQAVPDAGPRAESATSTSPAGRGGRRTPPARTAGLDPNPYR